MPLQNVREMKRSIEDGRFTLKPSFQALSRLQPQPRPIFQLICLFRPMCVLGAKGKTVAPIEPEQRVEDAFWHRKAK